MEGRLVNRILEVLNNLYDEKPTGVLSTPEIANILKISVKEAQGVLIYLKEKELINSFQNINDEWVQKISAKGIDDLDRRNKNLQKGDPTIDKSQNEKPIPTSVTYSKNENEDPKIILKFHQDEIMNSAKNYDYNSILVNLNRLYGYMNKIQLTKADRYNLENEIKLLHKNTSEINLNSIINNNNEFHKKNFDDLVMSDVKSVCNHLDSLIRFPEDIKFLTKPLKKKEGILSSLKNKLNSKKYLDVKNSPDVFYDNLLVEINKAYNNDMALTLLILLRKLFETGIIDIIWKKYKSDDLYLTKKGAFVQFSTVLEDLKKQTKFGDFGHFKDDLLEVTAFVDDIRKKGNQSAHRLTFQTSISEMEGIQKEVKRTTDILFRILANV